MNHPSMRITTWAAAGVAALAFLGGCAQAPQAGGDVNARMAALEARVDAAENVQKIERLFRAYGYYFDKGLWKETASLFTEDAQVEIAQRGIYRNRAGVERLFVGLFGKGRQCLPPAGLNNHIILQPIITVNPDGRTATGRARIIGMLAIRDGDFMLQEGIYNLRFRKDGGVWRIADLHYFGDLYMIMPAGLKTFAVPQSSAGTENPPDAPPSVVYKSWPGYYLPEFPYPNPVTGEIVDVAQCAKGMQ